MLERRKKEKKVNSFNAPNVYQFAENVSQRQYFRVTFFVYLFRGTVCTRYTAGSRRVTASLKAQVFP